MVQPSKDKSPLNQRSNRPNQHPVEAFSFAKSVRNPLIKALLIIGLVLALMGSLLVAYALLIAKPNLPKISVLTDYNPKTPLRVYTADKVLIGEFGEERR